jgi:restriction system protein
VTVLIEANPPGSWQDLEARVAQILTECGYEVERQKNIPLARGDVNIDVWADDHSSPQNIIVVECKHWATPVTKSVVHSFRTVVGDSGANTGLIVSSAGFQKGAVEAAAYSNVRLLDWTEFQTMFAVRWFRQYMSSTLEEQTDALHEYTEAMNSRILRKAGALSPDKQEQFRVLRERYFPLALSNFAFSLGTLSSCSP